MLTRHLTVVVIGLCVAALRSQQSARNVEERRVPSRFFEGGRRVWIYRPSGEANACQPECSLLIAFDGGEYRREMRVPTVLDSLIADGRIPPTLAIMIDNASGAARIDDLANRSQFARFVTDELIPWAQSHYPISRDPERVVLTGSSAGGLAAAYIAFRRPDLIGNVLTQSGAFWRGNEASNEAPWQWLTAQYAEAPHRAIRFVMEVGSNESHGALGGRAPSILEANRHLRDILRGKGYDVIYTEVPNGVHAPATWRPRLPIGLVALLSRH